jgi:hypothetical protein
MFKSLRLKTPGFLHYWPPQAKNLYQSCINIEKIEEEGESPLQEVLAELGRSTMLTQ